MAHQCRQVELVNYYISSSMIWTGVVDSICNEDNRYSNRASFMSLMLRQQL